MSLFFYLFFSSFSVSAAEMTVLKEGATGSEVTILQRDLKTLGVLNIAPTGYYGGITAAAVMKFQAHYGLVKDGIAGQSTFALINKLLGKTQEKVARGVFKRDNFLMPWFKGVKNVFTKGKTATVFDIDSGLSFKVKRTYGDNHADCEALTDDDTKIMKSIFGGHWSWQRRAVIVTVDGKRIAGSMAGMPHAGSDDLPPNNYIWSRSGGFGAGTNLDAVKGNDMDGHFDIHFLGSRTHGTNRVDTAHQSMVKKAAEWLKKK